MKTKSLRKGAVALTAAATLLPATASFAQEAPKLQIGGTTYTKWLYGNSRNQGAMFNFTTIPGEGAGENGIGTELELLLNARLSSAVEVRGRIHSRFSQNFWSNFGGFGKVTNDCVAGNCGEFDPRSNQYIKLRGMAVTLTPGYLIDSATIGANDFGQFDPFVVGRIRYIDRDNANGVLVQGSAFDRKLTYDVAGISLPRLWAGPNYSTGAFHTTDASYVFQGKYTVSEMFDVGGIFQYAIDNELNAGDLNPDNGRELYPRFRNGVGGLKAGFHLGSVLDVRGTFYRSYMHAEETNRFGDKPESGPSYVHKSFGFNGYSPTLAGKHEDNTWKVDVTLNDPLEVGLSLNAQAFSIGADYMAIMAARRESDVLLTEGHDATFAFPGPNNAKYGVFAGNPTVIGYGGWTNETQQLATINVDNEFTDFDEPMAETAIGWKGVTLNPVYSNGALDIAGEYSYITYNQNWQAWGDDTRALNNTQYPGAELDSGVLHNFRSAYQPFQEKQTHILVAKARYVLDLGRGLDVFGKVKYIHDNDKRLNDKKYLPYQDGDCPGGGVACANNRRVYGTDANGNTFSSGDDLYKNPGLVTQGDVTGYQWKPFDDISDDDRVLNYTSFNLGTGYQLTDDLYASLSYTKFLADLQDGNTAFQSYNLHQMVSGKHDKNLVSLKAKYILAGVEFGLEGQYLFGTYKPDYGSGFVPTTADEATAKDFGVEVGSLGFRNRFGGWNPLGTRSFEQMRLKAFMKAQF
ncbi:hypothetical protein ATI61_107236 [Archangium gephyra]|uniref:Uncharacterized protein n=1 Tax=Archangium gephyra TaxID=48 RepID=A0AAC8TJ03_9BACT|nr:hypothetical protein [Archangium gephyra]AKJ07787.1 Hypothetical protein AA314_09413 [Archangium gephyra]REG29540.1 hypothetical protein ATI61_107236 [Archangium gephyra]